MIDRARHLRQILLFEIGAPGQERIVRSTARVDGPGLAHEVAVRYASGAGFGAVAAGPVPVEALAPSEIVRFDAPRQVLAGARAALSEIRRALADAGAPSSREEVP